MLSEMQTPVLKLALSASGFAALVVVMGRLWTTSYDDIFGLPTSDLQLTTEDYAFRAKEVLVMITVAAVIAIGVWWHYHRRDAASDGGGADGAARRWEARLMLPVALAGFGLLLSVLLGVRSGMLTGALSPTQITMALGFLIGAIGGCLVLTLQLGGRWQRLVAFVALVAVVALVLPVAVVQLARESARFTMDNRELAHAVIEYAIAGAAYAAVCLLVAAAIGVPWLTTKGITLSLTGNGMMPAYAGTIAAGAMSASLPPRPPAPGDQAGQARPGGIEQHIVDR